MLRLLPTPPPSPPFQVFTNILSMGAGEDFRNEAMQVGESRALSLSGSTLKMCHRWWRSSSQQRPQPPQTSLSHVLSSSV